MYSLLTVIKTALGLKRPNGCLFDILLVMKISHIVSDLGEVLVFAKDKTYTGRLTKLHTELRSHSTYEPLSTFEINQTLLDSFLPYKSACQFHIFTAGLIHLVPEIWERLAVVFDDALTEEEIGSAKSQPQAFIDLAVKLHCEPAEILFIDDKLQNVVAAREAGARAIQFISHSLFIESFQKIMRLSDVSSTP